MKGQARFVAVDWGTSSFRLWVCDKAGVSLAWHQSDRGMSRLEPGQFAPYLDSVLSDLDVPLHLPVIVCGMAGARTGWREAPCVATPARLEAIQAALIVPPGGTHRSWIVPGISHASPGRWDVMRGEETLIFGALAMGAGSGLYCLPGTHSKWCDVSPTGITGFRTAMTGEIFNLLSTQSTLAAICKSAATDPLHEHAAFSAAVQEAMLNPHEALQHLFSVRAQSLLDPTTTSHAMRARLSGLLIGQEIAGAQVQQGQPVTLIAAGSLCDTYRVALAQVAGQVTTIDAEAAALSGLHSFALWHFELETD